MGIKNSFFEWMRLYFLNNDGKKLRITGSSSLKHPSADIDFVKKRRKEILLCLHEMSLLGVDSPLPDSLLKGVRSERDNSAPLREFLNMLQHHIAMLRFNIILRKSNFLMQELGDLKWKERFALYNERYSPEMLRCFFANLFPNAKISVHNFEPLRIENPAPIFLGSAKLNGETLLGKTCTTLTRAMRVDIKGVSAEQLLELKREKDFASIKFPFKIKINFDCNTHYCYLGNKNLEPLKLEKWL